MSTPNTHLVLSFSDPQKKSNIQLATGARHVKFPVKLNGFRSPFYSKDIQEALMHLVENFSSQVPPKYPTAGMLWYKPNTNPASTTTFGTIKVQNGLSERDHRIITNGLNNGNTISTIVSTLGGFYLGEPINPYDSATTEIDLRTIADNMGWVAINGVSQIGGAVPTNNDALWYDETQETVKFFFDGQWISVAKGFVRADGVDTVVTGDIEFSSDVGLKSNGSRIVPNDDLVGGGAKSLSLYGSQHVNVAINANGPNFAKFQVSTYTDPTTIAPLLVVSTNPSGSETKIETHVKEVDLKGANVVNGGSAKFNGSVDSPFGTTTPAAIGEGKFKLIIGGVNSEVDSGGVLISCDSLNGDEKALEIVDVKEGTAYNILRIESRKRSVDNVVASFGGVVRSEVPYTEIYAPTGTAISTSDPINYNLVTVGTMINALNNLPGIVRSSSVIEPEAPSDFMIRKYRDGGRVRIDMYDQSTNTWYPLFPANWVAT